MVLLIPFKMTALSMSFYMALLPVLQIAFRYFEYLLQVINNSISKAEQFLSQHKDLVV